MISNLLFDLGGVIMDIKRNNCVEAFRLLGLEDPNKYFGEFGQKGPFGQIEQGLISPALFHREIREMLPETVTDAQIDAAFNKFLIGIPVERLRQLQLLRQKYSINLLSNTNIIMWESKIAEEFRKDGLNVNGYFDGIVTSFEAKLLKPDPEIFLYAADKLGIKPEETLFLDDSAENVEFAKGVGFQGAQVPQGKEFYQILQEKGLA